MVLVLEPSCNLDSVGSPLVALLMVVVLPQLQGRLYFIMDH